MNHYNDHISLDDVDTIQKEFENKFPSSADDIFENGELYLPSAENFLGDYYKDYDKVFKSNSLSKRTKVLIALAVASAVYRPYCMDAYYSDVFENGWNEDQVKEAIEIAAAVKSGFTAVHSVKKINEQEVIQKD